MSANTTTLSSKILCVYCDSSVKGNKACAGVVMKESSSDTALFYATFPLLARTSHQAEVDGILYATEILLGKHLITSINLFDWYSVYIYNDNNIAVRQINGHNIQHQMTKEKIDIVKKNLTLIKQHTIIKVRCRRQRSAFAMYSAHYFARNHVFEDRSLVYYI